MGCVLRACVSLSLQSAVCLIGPAVQTANILHYPLFCVVMAAQAASILYVLLIISVPQSLLGLASWSHTVNTVLFQNDLLQMKINNALHHMSIKRGIEVLRAHNFNLGILRRRPSSDGGSPSTNCSTLNGLTVKKEKEERDVSLWTNHRVMEWLRMIDLSEYAANLRGSGVHGALIVSTY